MCTAGNIKLRTLALQGCIYANAFLFQKYNCQLKSTNVFKHSSQILTNKKNLHLAISAILITVVSLTYGLFPNSILPELFDFNVESTDLKQVFRALMGLYLGMAVLWMIGIFRPHYWKAATVSNVFFMIGLAVGRIISLTIDGMPSVFFSVGLVLELILALWGIRNLNKYKAEVNR
ncbi:MAG: DUF4345 domain-containing protein [Ferruginibacter sp.]